jgi:5-(aminomethyl)-3-furanmethanol phosphate kinase
MPRAHGPTVIKLGGSLAFSPHLRSWVKAIADSAGRAIIVPGGGPFADAVRAAQGPIGFDDRVAHHMALLAMEQYGCAIGGLDGRLRLAGSLEMISRALVDGKVPVWLPTEMALACASLPQSWDTTSDSLAAWLAGQIGAERLLLLKHVEVKEKAVLATDLAARNIVDKAFATFLTASGVPAFMLSPRDHSSVSHGEAVGVRIIA